MATIEVASSIVRNWAENSIDNIEISRDEKRKRLIASEMAKTVRPFSNRLQTVPKHADEAAAIAHLKTEKTDMFYQRHWHWIDNGEADIVAWLKNMIKLTYDAETVVLTLEDHIIIKRHYKEEP